MNFTNGDNNSPTVWHFNDFAHIVMRWRLYYWKLQYISRAMSTDRWTAADEFGRASYLNEIIWYRLINKLWNLSETIDHMVKGAVNTHRSNLSNCGKTLIVCVGSMSRVFIRFSTTLRLHISEYFNSLIIIWGIYSVLRKISYHYYIKFQCVLAIVIIIPWVNYSLWVGENWFFYLCETRSTMMDTNAKIYSLFQIPGDGSHLNLKFRNKQQQQKQQQKRLLLELCWLTGTL